VTRQSSPHDRRCNMVTSAGVPSASCADTATADEKLRHQLLAGIPGSELRTCIKVLCGFTRKRKGMMPLFACVTTASAGRESDYKEKSAPRRHGKIQMKRAGGSNQFSMVGAYLLFVLACRLRLYIGFSNTGPAKRKLPSRRCDRFLSPKLSKRCAPLSR